jgi:hypothetical protein
MIRISGLRPNEPGKTFHSDCDVDTLMKPGFQTCPGRMQISEIVG